MIGFMFINPNSLTPDTLNALIRDYAYTQTTADGDSESSAITNAAIDDFKQRLFKKEFVIHFSSNDEVADHDRISIRPVSDFSLSPTQVQY